ncbi:MAG: hypothetical protein COA81_00015 [Alphaproteobacteria bacterium]|nr:MAG: hypothetical protein COA81_00015 [Alphaproteobacteria bacterium]
MKREGFLVAGKQGSLHWSCNGEEIGWIKYVCASDHLRLIYRVRKNGYGEDWQDIKLTVPLVFSHCRFGGTRPYFICPNQNCNRRVQHLYGSYPYFLCRHCLDLAYPVQREKDYDRAARRAEKIRERVGYEFGILDGPVFFKPKGMHQKTFDRLQIEETYYRETSLRGMVADFDLNLDNRFR